MNDLLLRLAAALSTALWAFLGQGLVIGLAYALARVSLRDPRLRYAAGVAALAAMPLALAVTTLVAFLGRPADPGGMALAGMAPEPVPSWVLGAWLAGESLLLARWTGGWWLLHRLGRRASAEVPASWRTMTHELAQALGLRQPLRLRISDELDAPLAFGFARSLLVFPRGIEQALGLEGVRALLAHELAHLARHDTRVLLLQRLVETLLFYHPVCWWISRKVSDDREFCTDDLAVEILGDRQVYARALAGLEASRSGGHGLALAAHGGRLMPRLLRLVASPRSEPAGRFTPYALGGGFLLLLLGGALLATPVAGEIEIPWLPESVARWNPLFEQAAARHGVDAELLAIMALVESRGNPDAVSSLGARGIMQVLPSTAQIIADTRGMDYDPERLGEPELNIDLAAWYLAKHQLEFPSADPLEQVEWLAAAYNGGEHALRRHLRQGDPLSAETERYRRHVRLLWLARDREHAPELQRTQ